MSSDDAKRLADAAERNVTEQDERNAILLQAITQWRVSCYVELYTKFVTDWQAKLEPILTAGALRDHDALVGNVLKRFEALAREAAMKLQPEAFDQ